MIRSMTGFGRGHYSGGALNVSVEMSTVNRRTLEFGITLPREWQSLEGALQGVLKEHFHRGRLHVSVMGLPEGEGAGFQWDEAGLQANLDRLKALAEANNLEWLPDAELLARLASMNKTDMALPVNDKVQGFVLEAIELACRDVVRMRETEGAALAEDLKQRLKVLDELLEEIKSVSASTVPRYREHLFSRLQQAGLELDLDDDRVLKEVALFADKCDIAEELTRLGSHLSQFGESLNVGSPIGRKLEFILQEINREINTIGSKANNYGVSRQVIEAKNEIERIREQIQNIE